MEEKQEKQLVIMDNALVQTSRHKMTLNEHKAFAFIISRIPDFNDIENDGYITFRKADFCSALDIETSNGGNNAHLKETIENLVRQTIEVEYEDKWKVYSILQEAEIKDYGETIGVKINSGLKPYIYALKERFTEYQLMYLLNLKSRNALRLYEWLKSYHLPKVVGYVEKLKDMFGVNYKNAYELIRKSLEPAVAEINEKTDLHVTFENQRTGRKVSAIVFHVADTKKWLDLSEATFDITHISDVGMPETFTVQGFEAAQALINEHGFENGRTFIVKTLNDVKTNANDEFTLH